MDYQGYFVDNDDGTVVTAPITPVFQCLQDLGTGLFTAWFGYDNTNPNNVYIESLGENAIYRNGAVDKELAPLTKFIPQAVDFALAVG